jgi:hypothetical protein
VDDSSGACIECSYAAAIAKPQTNPTSTTAATGATTEAKKDDTGDSRQPTTSIVNLPAPPNYPDIDVGDVVDIKGSVAMFWNEKQIKIERDKIKRIRSTEEEIALWERRSKFRQDVLHKPWVLTDEEILACRKKAEGEQEPAKKRHQKESEERTERKRRKPEMVDSSDTKTQKKTKDTRDRNDVAKMIARQVREGRVRGYGALGI